MPKRKAPSSDSASPDPRSRRGTRHATVYDAVANRVNYEGFVHSRRVHDTHGELHKRSQTAQTADEVLGRRKNAPEVPIPYAEGGGEGLPDSDLLIAVHQYVADFYGAHGMGAVSYRSMDETALLAVGMLLEETALLAVGMLLEETVKSCLGEDGDLALIEQESSSEEEDAEEQAPAESPPKTKKKKRKSKKKKPKNKEPSAAAEQDG